MSTYILIHGAWHGGWCWAAVKTRLEALGHTVYAPDLKGLSTRAAEMDATITADTHASELADLIRSLNGPVILVGHSYGGIVISGAAGYVPDQITHLYYLDALVPETSGVPALAPHRPDRVAQYRARIEQGAVTLDPVGAETWVPDPDTQAWVLSQCTPHPLRCFALGVTLTGGEATIARTYIRATTNPATLFKAVEDRLRCEPGWAFAEIATHHHTMIQDPNGLVALITQDH